MADEKFALGYERDEVKRPAREPGEWYFDPVRQRPMDTVDFRGSRYHMKLELFADCRDALVQNRFRNHENRQIADDYLNAHALLTASPEWAHYLEVRRQHEALAAEHAAQAKRVEELDKKMTHTRRFGIPSAAQVREQALEQSVLTELKANLDASSKRMLVENDIIDKAIGKAAMTASTSGLDALRGTWHAMVDEIVEKVGQKQLEELAAVVNTIRNEMQCRHAVTKRLTKLLDKPDLGPVLAEDQVAAEAVEPVAEQELLPVGS